ncbi:MAG TPA: cell division protein CrgA [Mycobacteriales bacterium]|nr:cell division protein CrgA [Mycobacteriales bacterium]
MPKSKVRKKAVYTPPANVLPTAATQAKRKGPSPTWYPVTMVVLMLLGLAYIVLNYLAPNLAGIRSLGNWNFAVGFGLMIGGLGMAVRWR